MSFPFMLLSNRILLNAWFFDVGIEIVCVMMMDSKYNRISHDWHSDHFTSSWNFRLKIFLHVLHFIFLNFIIKFAFMINSRKLRHEELCFDVNHCCINNSTSIVPSSDGSRSFITIWIKITFFLHSFSPSISLCDRLLKIYKLPRYAKYVKLFEHNKETQSERNK